VQSEGPLAHLPGEWIHLGMRTQEPTTSSHTKALWKCEKYGGRWDARISSHTRRVQRTGCPMCAAESMARGGAVPHLLGEWNQEMEDCTPGSGLKVSWKCGNCGGRRDARIGNLPHEALSPHRVSSLFSQPERRKQRTGHKIRSPILFGV
jgi:hypothetical protein